MGRYDPDDDFDEELDIRRYRSGIDRPHSGAGVTAFAMGVIAMAGAIGAAVIIIALDAVPPGPDDDLWLDLLELFLVGCGTLSIAGFALGLAGSFQSDRKPLFGMLGTVVNVLAGVAILICLGMLTDL